MSRTFRKFGKLNEKKIAKLQRKARQRNRKMKTLAMIYADRVDPPRTLADVNSKQFFNSLSV